jgi:hypothetical protein
MAAIVIIFIAGSVLGLLVGIVVGWAAAPAVWANPEGDAPESMSVSPDFVGMHGGHQ